MRALVVYDSIYGNTHAVATEIAAGLSGSMEVEALAAAETSSDKVGTADLIVVGSPTHAHGIASASTHKSAVHQEEQRTERADPDKPAHELDEAATGESMREWLHSLPEGEGRHAAAFDTRFDKPRALTGSAARGVARRLRHHGYEVVDEPTSFFVEHSEGPLAEGETARAREWGEALAARMEAGDS